MSFRKRSLFVRGLRDGIPIFLGYLAVGFTLGIAAKRAGLGAFQAGLASFLTNASAGQYAGFTVIAEGGTYLEMALMILVANARYLLMSCALTQKLGSEVGLGHRMLIGFDVTDEIFGVCIGQEDKLSPYYAYGVICAALPGWSGGTALGVLMGNLLPGNLVSALSVGLYGMFLAVIIPPARKDKVVGVLVVLSMALSFLVSRLSIFSGISSGTKIILLTVVISAVAALLFPRKEANQ
jgi:predicted branched-subunit amino acid permease